MLVVTTISITILGYFLISQEYIKFSESSQEIRKEFLNQNKQLITYEVNDAVELIQHSIESSRQELRDKVKSRLYEGYDLVDYLYQHYHDQIPDNELKQLILSSLRPLKHSNKRGYYSVTSIEGRALLLQTDESNDPLETLLGQSRLDQKDINGKFFVRDFIRIAREKGEGFVEYYRKIPNQPDKEPSLKISYIKYFKPYNWIIATGDYVESYLKELQVSLIRRLADVRFGVDGYLFGVKYNGDPLFSNGEITYGTDNLWELTDPNGIKIIQEERKIVEHEGSGFLEYHWTKLEGDEIYPKLSYISGIPEWQWIIGAGVYLDNIESYISEERANLRSRINNHILKVVALLALILVIIINTSIYISSRLKKTFKSFVSFFQKAEEENIQMDPSTVHFSEFQKLAGSANKLLEKRTQAEQNLQLYKEIFFNSSDSIEIIKPDFTFYDQNPSHRELFGYSIEELKGKTPEIYMGEKDFNEMKHALLEYEFYRDELFMKTADGQDVFVDISAFPIYDLDKNILFYAAMKRDNTERKRVIDALEKSEEKYRNLIETMEEGISIVDAQETIIFANRAASLIFDVPHTDLIGMNLRDVIFEEDYEQILFQTQRRKQGNRDRYEVRIQTLDNEIKTLLVTSSPLFEEGEYIGAFSVFADISDIKRSQHEIEKSLKEKVILLREIHHRVKNNMQIIISLLNLQAMYIEDKEIVERFKIVENRIRSMAIIHEKLYESDNFVDIDLGQYIKELMNMLYISTGLPKEKISFSLIADEIKLDLNKAVPCGLLCNEILTNIFKHAFPGDRTGTVSIELKLLKNQKVQLIFQDDGVGFNGDSSEAGNASLGMQLINDLVSQLGGTLDISSNNGVKYTIIFSNI